MAEVSRVLPTSSWRRRELTWRPVRSLFCFSLHPRFFGEPMTAYVIADVQVTDAAAYEPYRPLAAASVAQFGGRFLAKGGSVELLAGEPQPERIVVIEFADPETPRSWYCSEEYQRALEIRQAASRGRFFPIEGAG
jgi:uncharacterized protein (DUF1330 family)